MKATKNNMWDSFAAALVIKGRKPEGSGWKTASEIVKEHKVGLVKAARILKVAVESGKMERFSGSQVNKAGKCSCQYWYRPIP